MTLLSRLSREQASRRDKQQIGCQPACGGDVLPPQLQQLLQKLLLKIAAVMLTQRYPITRIDSLCPKAQPQQNFQLKESFAF